MHILVVATLFTSVLSKLSVDELDSGNPVSKVVGLLNEMKAQVEKEAAEDKELYDEMACWCKTNDKEKTEAVEIAEKSITDLTAAIEEYVARKATLINEIDALGEENQANTNALAEAEAQREKEAAEFTDEEANAKQASAALKQAIEVLSKVQLTQMPPKHEVLLQLKSLGIEKVIKRASQWPKFKDVMQEDLWNLLSDLGGRSGFLPGGRTITGLMSQEPIEGGGAAAGAKSYNSRSGEIVGMLTTMKTEFDNDLAASQKEELQAQISYEGLRAAKEAQIAAANAAIEEKSAELADTGEKLAKAKQDLEDTQNALSADQKFLIDLAKRCKVAEEEYTERAKTRNEEILAIGETIKILTSDESRDLFAKTTSFVQVKQFKAVQHHAQGQTQEIQRKWRHEAANKILGVAHRHQSWQLAGLAVSVQLDAFGKIKEIMDKMVAELKKQQEEEVKKKEQCTADIDTNEDELKEKGHQIEDLESTISDLTGTLATLKEGLESAKSQIAESQVSLKRAGEDRKAANAEFQGVVADQRATVHILNKALERLQKFYAKKELLLQVKKGGQPEPGAAAPPPPPSAKPYEKSGGAGGVMQMISQIISEAEQAEAEAITAENEAQAAYAEMVENTNAALAALATEITEKTIAESEARASKEVADKDLMAAQAEKKGLDETGIALHKGCDFLLENFEIRQKARAEEIDAIGEAKAILSGSDFGL